MSHNQQEADAPVGLRVGVHSRLDQLLANRDGVESSDLQDELAQTTPPPALLPTKMTGLTWTIRHLKQLGGSCAFPSSKIPSRLGISSLVLTQSHLVANTNTREFVSLSLSLPLSAASIEPSDKPMTVSSR